jgi:hypothetical protein
LQNVSLVSSCCLAAEADVELIQYQPGTLDIA